MGYTEKKIKFEDTKGITRSRKSKDRQHNDKKDKQLSTKHYIENQDLTTVIS